jgi:hypothetical protein
MTTADRYAWALDPETELTYARERGAVRVTDPVTGRSVTVEYHTEIHPGNNKVSCLYLDGSYADVGDDLPAWLGLLDKAGQLPVATRTYRF